MITTEGQFYRQVIYPWGKEHKAKTKRIENNVGTGIPDTICKFKKPDHALFMELKWHKLPKNPDAYVSTFISLLRPSQEIFIRDFGGHFTILGCQGFYNKQGKPLGLFINLVNKRYKILDFSVDSPEVLSDIL